MSASTCDWLPQRTSNKPKRSSLRAKDFRQPKAPDLASQVQSNTEDGPKPQLLPEPLIMNILARTGHSSSTTITKATCWNQWRPADITTWLVARHGPTTALIKASLKGRAAVCAELLLPTQPWTHASKPRTVAADVDDCYALMFAALGGHLEACQVLLQAEPPARADAQDSCALVWAAEEGHLAVCELLLQRGAQANAQGCEALIKAAAKGHVSICHLLLQSPQNPATADACNSGALVAAAVSGHTAVCELLLNANPPAQANAQGSIALIEAAQRGHLTCCQLLLHASPPASTEINAALSAALHGKHKAVCEFLLEYKQAAAAVASLAQEAVHSREAAQHRHDSAGQVALQRSWRLMLVCTVVVIMAVLFQLLGLGRRG